MSHPSYLRLDRVALGAADAALEAHLGDCVECQAHLTALKQPVRAIVVQPRRSRWRWISALGLAGACAMLVLALAEDGVRAKGAPSVGVYVKRGDDVFLWNGSAPLRADDRVRLRIRSGGYRQVRVTDADGNVLYAGPLASPETTLPLSWRIEAPDERESLHVVLSDSPNHPLSFGVDLTLPVENEP